jgi:hypothetical protein
MYDVVGLASPTGRQAIDEQTISETDNSEEENESRSQDAIICQQTPNPEHPEIAIVAYASPKPEPPAITTAVDDVKIIVPSKAVQGEIRYVINSLSKTNLETKVRIHPNTLIIHYAIYISIFFFSLIRITLLCL